MQNEADKNIGSTRIGLGLAAIGRPEYINLRQEKDLDKSEINYEARALKLLDFAYAMGIRDYDTAPSYGRGEAFLMKWYGKHGYADLKLSTKWGYTYVADWQIGYEGAHEIKEHSLAKLSEQWASSKQLLPGLKTYQIHSATFDSGVLDNTEVLQGLNELKKKFNLKIGMSVSGHNQLEILEAARKVKIDGLDLFNSFQVTYNILETSTHHVVRSLIEDGKIVIIKEAMANGRLFKNDSFSHYAPLYDHLEKLSKKHKTTVDALALRFVIDNLNPTVVLSGAATENQLASNLMANSIGLNQNELNYLSGFAANRDDYWKERSNLVWN